MIAHELTANRAQRLVYGRNLRHDVRAVAIFSDHPVNAANLALDAPQPFEIAIARMWIDGDRLALHALHGLLGLDVGLHRRRRRLFVTTLTELNAIAPLAMIGFNRIPNFG